ncbi:hypothetical protein Bbelb_060940, partial [Branchiostoma belcheri]
NAMFEKPINVTLDAATGQPVVLPLSGTVTVQTEKADGSKETVSLPFANLTFFLGSCGAASASSTRNQRPRVRVLTCHRSCALGKGTLHDFPHFAQLTVLSKGINSLKVLAELPIIVVLMYQLYKQNVHSAVAEFIPLIMNTIVLTPSAQARASPQFNRELYVDFVAAQIKTLSFLAYIIRIYQESVTTYANQMVKGMLSLLTNCPQEVTHLRKELLIAARHILATDLRNRFVPHIDRLFDEKVLIGTGWTTRETLRPLAYSTLADLVHHVRQHLQLSDLALAVHLFSKNVHDDLLPSSIQTMSCKLLLNLVECIKSDQDGGNGREILMRMLEVFVLKFHTIAKFQLPGIFAKCKNERELDLKAAAIPPPPTLGKSDKEKEEEKSKPAGGQFNNFSVSDCRSLVKTLVCGVKTITWGAQSCKTPGETSFGPSKQFQPKETAIFSALVRHALCALDIYQINVTPSGQPYIRAQNSQTVRMKEEKDVLEHFAGVFTMMNLLTFKEIFSTTIEFMVERIYHNYALQIVANTFLANPSTSATFATILVDYLLDRLEEIGSANIERSNLYLKLFKLVFGSVSLFAAENEQMLKPHLHKIVNSSMELAQTAKEPYNYFLLMRALFRSIGGGSHDLLYQEFLPLLPHLLQGLNNLQSGLHKQHMKDLFVELCLTVPVRLSSLLPYLPMLMDPLVSALNGSQTLVSQVGCRSRPPANASAREAVATPTVAMPTGLSRRSYLPPPVGQIFVFSPTFCCILYVSNPHFSLSQGLRTLELCVDNLQPEFLWDHIQPVRAELMQALWRTLRNPAENIAQVAFRVLGKFGGNNRKMLMDPQKLTPQDTDVAGPCITINFLDCKQPINMPVDKVIDTAVSILKTPNVDMYYRRQALEVIKGFLVGMMSLEDNKLSLHQLLAHQSFAEREIPPPPSPLYKCPDSMARKAFEQALAGAMMCAVIKDLRASSLPFVANIIRHYTMVALVQQCGPFPLSGGAETNRGMDPLVIVDAVAVCMSHEEKELCKIGEIALAIIIEVTATACQLPLFEYIVERLCSCCYERAWYAKYGGYITGVPLKLSRCVAIRFLLERTSLRWILEHELTFLKALFFVSSGALDLAKADLEKLLKMCATPIQATPGNRALLAAQEKAFREVTLELVREAMHSLRVLAKVTDKTITAIMEPHKNVLEDMIPPKKHLLRHQPANAQIGLMEGNTFCTTLQPRLFTIDLNIMEHKVFFTELLNLCEAEDSMLIKLPCYKNMQSLTPLRISALNALAACHYIPQVREKIFTVLFKSLNSSSEELQTAAMKCMKDFLKHQQMDAETIHNVVRPLLTVMVPEEPTDGCRDDPQRGAPPTYGHGYCRSLTLSFLKHQQMDAETIHNAVRPLLMVLGDYRSLTLSVIKRLTNVTTLFPNVFNEKLCDQLMAHLKKWMDVAIIAQKGGQRTDGNGFVTDCQVIKVCAAIIHMFHTIPAASIKMIDPLVTLVLKAERALLLEIGSPFRDPLMKFLLRYPAQSVDLFIQEAHLKEPQTNRTFTAMLKREEAKPFRDVIQANPLKLANVALSTVKGGLRPGSPNYLTQQELQYQAIHIYSILVKHDPAWLSKHPMLMSHLKQIWISDDFQEKHSKEQLSISYWREPKLLVKCLLSCVKQNPGEVELLFQLLRAFTLRFISNFHFLKTFLEEELYKVTSIDQKRTIFLEFVKLFHDQSFPQELKAKALQHILIPMFSTAFQNGQGEKALQHILIPMFSTAFQNGQGEKLIGGPPTPESDDETNLISVFINKVIDPENPYGHTSRGQPSTLVLSHQDAVRILLLQFSALLDAVRILLLQFSALLDAVRILLLQRQGNKLRRLMTFAWPCLLPKNCVDPATKYHGHLLLSHIIAKFAIHKRIVLQVFHSLLKAHALEARKVVQQALEILTPAMPARMEDGNAMLTHWTKKIIVEEGHTVAQLVHMLQLLVRHYKVYYPVRHHLIQHMVSSMQRLGFTPSASIEHRRLAVELCEVIVKWEMQRVKDEQEQQTEGEMTPLEGVSVPTTSQVKRAMSVESPQDSKRVRHSSQTATPSRNPQVELVSKPIEKIHADNVVNFLVKIACQVNEASTTQGSPGEMLSKRCVFLVKTALKPDLWPNSELRLAWIDKLLMTISGQANFANICTALELLTYLLGTLSPQNILATFKPLQRGIAACMTCGNQKVVRFVQQLLAKLMSIFPTEPSTSSVASQYEELECLYAAVGKVIYEGLTNYEKAANGSPSSLFGTLWILKSACVNNASYIDRLISVFMRTLQKMNATEDGEGTSDTCSSCRRGNCNDLIILSLDLIKTRVAVMSAEMRKNFIQVILTQLIERSPDAKILKAITRIMEEWIKIKGPMAVNATPTLKEKAHLLTKMMHFTEKRFPDDNELNAQFLELVNYIYRDESLRGSELTVKLEPAFLAGLRCVQSHIRAKFVEVFDQSIRRRLYDRLLYMTCSQNWESMGTHFWVKQCTELMLAVSDRSTPVSSHSQLSMLPSITHLMLAVSDRSTPVSSHSQLSMLPSITHVINLADSRDKMAFAMAMRVKEEPMDVEGEKQEEDMEIDIELTSDEGKSKDASGREEVSKGDLRHQLSVLTNRHGKFLESLKEVKTTSFLTAVSQLCHYSTQLSHSTWVELFPRLWKHLVGELGPFLCSGSHVFQKECQPKLGPFLCSGSHVFQKECQPSAIHTFVEGISRCVPPIPIRPCVLKYLGKTHNLWHRSTLMLEQSAFESGFSTQSKNKQANEYYEQEGITPPQQETLDMLSELYSLLREEDMWAGLWQKRCKFPETATAIAYEQQGFFEQAQTTYEGAMTKARQDHNSSSAAPNIIPEYRLCSKELNQWDLLMEYGSSKAHPNPHLVLESAWRVPNWASMKDALVQVEQSCPKEMAWKVNMYRGYIAICHPEEHHLNLIERLVEMSSSQSIKEWRRLPLIVANIHVPLLQAAQQVIELQEASQIHTGLQPANIGRNSSLHDMKAIVKTWRNRLPLIADDLSHWSDIFMWRHHHYNAIVSAYEGHVQHDPQSSNHSMLGVHASAHSIIHYGKIARKHGLIGTCLDSLSRIHTIPSVPIVDCFQKIRQQVKCYLQMSGVMGRNECMQPAKIAALTFDTTFGHVAVPFDLTFTEWIIRQSLQGSNLPLEGGLRVDLSGTWDLALPAPRTDNT